MIKTKFCGLSRIEDIDAVNELLPEYAGFVFWEKSKRYVSPEKASELKAQLNTGISAVGVFLDADVEYVAELLNAGIIDIAQLHGHEDEAYIEKLRDLSDKPIIKAFNITSENDIHNANMSSADFVLLDSKAAGSGNVFDWSFINGIKRPYFLAGGLNVDNIEKAVRINPYAVDVSSGIETDGIKDKDKMKKFIQIVRNH